LPFLPLELASKADEGMLIDRRHIVQAGLGLLASSAFVARRAAAPMTVLSLWRLRNRSGWTEPALRPWSTTKTVASVLKRQVRLASRLGFYARPSFMRNSVGILGYPGRESTGRMIAAVRDCDKLAC
jgi:hypothetical protein